ncbi:RagB/SusD family nutrient uptake outer membrane protein [Zunongwangia sp. HGR-M22]|uniref:RagB/SusD family nutrient uptake outer membrane protein n=1 Tax=Zunongwangia sp. HGR-M22 TaxID=3015168 RepID=UPI0022DDDC92|nr:RagB/SusD family nutrient uptake outer membrane protein [Zunongwangia sp. HGR-M22]WBL24266.1 RagB/SusD family nutrient uptake outer membrane protein [Zunongwangia sp. HGR-M22]
MKRIFYIKIIILAILSTFLYACESFVEIDVPDDKMVTTTVFSSTKTAQSAMQGIYYQLFNADFSGGTINSISVLSGLSADVLEPINRNNTTLDQFTENELFNDNPGILGIWSSSYNTIYLANNLLEGLQNSDAIPENVSLRLEGQALFIRAFCHFYLVNLFGDVPLVLTTDYQENALIPRESSENIYHQIVLDLERSREILEEDYFDNEKYTINKFAATSLLARVQLYLENWNEAERLSTEVINSSQYELTMLNETFLANSDEAIWQISPAGRGNILTSTSEGYTFIGTSTTRIKLNENFVSDFKDHDLRLLNWIGEFSNSSNKYSYVYKYKDRSSINNITEYAMVLRLAEQFLIRAEARAQMGNISGALEDLNTIRQRAGLTNIEESDINASHTLVDFILEERKKELFAEWGHRWLDLNRLNKTNEVLNEKEHWDTTDGLYPIPSVERSKNPNLTQNPGY